MNINLEKAVITLQHIIIEAGGELPENQLAVAIINQAINDIFVDHKLYKIRSDSSIANYRNEQKKAFNWINNSPDFRIICDLAFLNDSWVYSLLDSSYDKYLQILNDS